MNRRAIRKGVTVALVVVGLCGAAIGQAWSDTAAQDADSLRAVTLLFRHSIVSPKYTAPKVKAEWPMGLRQLTALGIREMYDTGQELRRKDPGNSVRRLLRGFSASLPQDGQRAAVRGDAHQSVSGEAHPRG